MYYFSFPPHAPGASEVQRKPSSKPSPKEPVLNGSTVHLYPKDMERLDHMVRLLQESNVHRANRSSLIRHFIRTADPSRLPDKLPTKP